MLTLTDIRAAYERISEGIVRTPCVPALGFGDFIACRLHLKLENLQRTGSFKDRGSLNRLLDLSVEERARGVVTASAGNHAQAVAYHAGRLGIPASVVMPENTPLIKIANTRRHGAQITLRGATLSDAMHEARRLETEEHLVMVHPFDDDRVIAGQGTIALELLEQVPDLSALVVPIGGGGLISGIAVKRIGERTFPVIEQFVTDIVTVSEEQLAAAVHMLIERQKLVAEGAGAAPLAALVGGQIPLKRADVAVAVISGGNIDVNIIQRIIERGLVREGRVAHLMVKMRDRPGSLAHLTGMVAQAGANVLEIAHRRAFAEISVGEVGIVMHLETRGRAHVEEIKKLLEADGLRVQDDV